MARVSVIVTCFNLGRYLEETLASIVAQTYHDFELCIVDDGSDDPATIERLERLKAQTRIVRTENHGLSAARNTGVSLTTGEYICCVDADDLLAPTLLERSVAYLDAHPSVAFVSHWLEAFGDESWEWKPERCDLSALLDVNTVNGAALVRRSAIEAVGGWDESLRDGCEDWDLWIAMVKRGLTGAIIPEVLFRYRRRPDSMSRLKFAGNGHARVYRRLVEKHADAFEPHLMNLVVRRVADAARARSGTCDFAERLELQASPALARARDDLAAAERRRQQWDREVERRVLCTELDALRDESTRQRESLRDAGAEAERLDRLRHHAEQEAQALRASWSWRITRPLRSIVDMFGTTRGRS